MITTREQARAFRALIERASQTVVDSDAQEMVSLFPKWSGEKNYSVGDKVAYNDVVYAARQAVTANPTWTPDIVPALWEVVGNPAEEGTFENPIVASRNMRYYQDKYYLEGETKYLCIRQDTSDGTVLAYLPSELVGIYFEEVGG